MRTRHAAREQVMDLTAELTKRVEARTKWPAGVGRLEVRVGEDWIGNEALFIDAILLDDDATDDESIRELSEFSHVVSDAAWEIEPKLFPYVRFTLQEDGPKAQAG